MKQFVRYFIGFILLLTGCMLFAQIRYSVSDVPNVQLENRLCYVSDPEKVLAEEDTDTLNRMLTKMRDSLQVEAAIVVLPYIDTEAYGSAKEFATSLFNTWKLGNKETNRGLLILLLTGEGEREVVFETGYGIEGELTDGLSKVIQTQKMIPLLKEKQFGPGLILGVQEIGKVFNKTTDLNDPDAWTSEDVAFWRNWAILGLIIMFSMLYFLWKESKNSTSSYHYLLKNSSMLTKGGCIFSVFFFPHSLLYVFLARLFYEYVQNQVVCERCGKRGTMRKKSGKPQILQKASIGQKGYKRYTFICRVCGGLHFEDMPYEYVSSGSSGGGGWSSGGSSWGSSSSSGGGSWGGGSSGGGGASSKF